MLIRTPVSEARADFADLLSKVKFGANRVVLSRNGKDVAVLMSMADYALLSQLEDAVDIETSREALKDKRRFVEFDPNESRRLKR